MPQLRQYSLCDIQDEVRALATRGVVGRQQLIYELGSYFNDREWERMETILVRHEYLLRDRVIDLIGQETWISD
jgi:ABC-type phosphate/phosphonate transport system permease subunit